jgi:5-formyltetrahydrofolate cyclo-ligase
VAAYWALPGEPPTAPLIAALRRRGRRVLLPVLRPDGDLDWAAYDDTRSLAAAARGLAEPVGNRLGLGAVRDADVVVAPGLAVGADGIRLGRGGGSYDRALARVVPPTLVVCLLWDGELLDVVPTAPHDRPVDVAVTPTAVHRFPLRSG